MKLLVGLVLAFVTVANVHAADSPTWPTTPGSDTLDPDCPQIVCAAIMSWEECAKNLPEKCRPKTRDPLTWGDLGLNGYDGPGTTENGDSTNKQSSRSSQSSTCSDICPDIYSPVCGSDGVKYSNPCKLKAAACQNPERNIVKSDDSTCFQ